MVQSSKVKSPTTAVLLYSIPEQRAEKKAKNTRRSPRINDSLVTGHSTDSVTSAES